MVTANHTSMLAQSYTISLCGDGRNAIDHPMTCVMFFLKICAKQGKDINQSYSEITHQ